MSKRWILAAFLLAAAPAPAAVSAASAGPSFDCAKAATPVEKAICANPELARLDRQMAAAYAAAVAITPTPVSLRAGQRDFLAERSRGDDGQPVKTVNIAQLTERYQFRIQALTDETARAGRATAARIRDDDLGRVCIDVAITGCKVESSGPVPGSAPYGGLFFQLQGPSSEDGFTRGVVVLQADRPGFLKPVMWNFDGDIPAPPEVVASPAGPLLIVPSIHGGTGVFNAELIFRPVAGGWRDLEIDAWRKPFDRQLPAGVGVWKGVIYDWKTLTMETMLWKDDDANCCPSGGSAEAAFAIQGDRLTLKSMSVDRTPPRGN
ncbi:MAG: hypothetical protein V4466_18150 [Pseudomonadota bacterium]